MVRTARTRLPGTAFLIFAAALVLTSAMLLLIFCCSLFATISTPFSIVHRLIKASDRMQIDEEAAAERQSLAT